MNDPKCKVCRSPDLRRLVELGWNAKMPATDIANGLGALVGTATILKHLKEHAEGSWVREIPVEDAKPMRARVLAIQRLQVEEIERRVELAQESAKLWNEVCQPGEQRDWSHYFDILAKDMQSAVSSILKTQSIEDKHESSTAGLKIDLFRALSKGGMAPAGLIGDGAIEGEAVEVD